MITTVLLAQLMLYLVLCVWDIVAAARACRSIIPVAIFGLLWTFLLKTYVQQPYFHNPSVPWYTNDMYIVLIL